MDREAGDVGVRCMWRPDTTKMTNFDLFRERINKKFGFKFETYQELYEWSVNSYDDFWEELWHFCDVKYSKLYDQVIDTSKNIAEIPEWFHGSRLNFTENCLKYNDDRVAIYFAREGHEQVKKRTFAQLHKTVAQYAAAMQKMGVQKGDRVVGYIHNGVESIEAMLAAASIGAIWSSTSPEFGVTGVLDRFSQIQPKLLFSVNAVVYNGKIHNHLDKLEKVTLGLPDLERVVVIPYVTEDGVKTDISDIKNSCSLEEFLATGCDADGTVPELVFEQLPFSHPLYIMYSSGTTGAPKCMVHSAGGTLMKHLSEHVLHCNITRNDVMMYYTTTGWMMWNWLVTAIAPGAAIVCYDGSPLVPHTNVLWDLIDKIGITILGCGAKWLDVLDEKGVKPRKSHSLKSLHSILTTGSPLKPVTFDYVYRDIKEDLLLGSMTGGTDIVGCFAGANPTLPVHRGEIQCRKIGTAMECFDEDGKPVFGETGELVCTKPFPSMPTHFWNDPDSSKYQKAYFKKYPGVWAHGDFCRINPQTGGVWMLGRSDGTLNPNGVRFGSAEIYNVVENFKEIADSLCVPQRSADGAEERVILFLKMSPGSQFNEEIVKQVRLCIRTQLSARHMPAILLETKDIPYTHSAKKVEIAVKKIIAGEDVQVRGAYANPDSLDLYYNLPELADF